ncbi:MAG: GNAT family N-acetyltransferase [Pedobacter sp.]|nr:MAG: GNAT family N-acetyltransferase [Pedobacter sp.]
MNILILGSGGRESAFAWKIAQSELCSQLFIAPGNGGTGAYGKNINLNPNDFNAVKALVLKESIGMVIVGPEEPLVNGIHDFFLADEALAKIPVIGPKKEGAILEGSKDFSKQFMARHGIPTPGSQSFRNETLQHGLDYLSSHSLPIVLKADGLAAGKGVVICQTVAEAQEELKLMLGGKFGNAGSLVVIEEYLTGIELSVFVLTDGDVIIGYCAVMINDEPAYADIIGNWQTNDDFVVIHRVAIAESHLGKGLAKKILGSVKQFAIDNNIRSIKADTNFDNLPMMRIFEQLGYQYCGEVYFRGNSRRAYEKVLHTEYYI